VRAALDVILEVITEQMTEGNAVSVAGFGRFEVKEHKGPKVDGLDGEVYEVQSRLVPSFRPYPHLRLKLQGRVPEPEPPDPRRPPWWR